MAWLWERTRGYERADATDKTVLKHASMASRRWPASTNDLCEKQGSSSMVAVKAHTVIPKEARGILMRAVSLRAD
jgi:hypothetical protein